MTFLPIVERELRVRSRQTATWRTRWISAASALIIALGLLGAGGRSMTPSQRGSNVFTTLTVLAFIWCLLEGARQTFDSISEEKREGTLGLLFLTDLKGYDVVFGKLAATSLNSFYSLVALLPVLGLGLLAGGVTGGEFVRMVLALLITLFFSLSAGIYISARSHDAAKAFVGTLALILNVGLAVPLLDPILSFGHGSYDTAKFSLASPGYACFMAFDVHYGASPVRFWLSLAMIHLTSWLLLTIASMDVMRHWQTAPEHLPRPTLGLLRPAHDKPSSRAALILDTMRQRRRRLQLLERNPILWMLCRHQPTQVLLACGAFLVTACYYFPVLASLLGASGRSTRNVSVASLALFGLHYVTRFFIVWLACGFFVQARRSGSIELLLTTPLRLHEMITGQWMALRRQLLWPVGVAVGAHLVVTLFIIQFLDPSSSRQTTLASVGFFSVVSAFVYYLDFTALGYTGMWYALSLKKPAQAPVKTFLIVTVMPFLVCSGFPMILGGRSPGSMALFGNNPLVACLIDCWIILWAKGKLEKEHRRVTGPRLGTGES